jgi:acetylornithine deacetylase
VRDAKMYGRGACDMKSGTIGALYALDAIKVAGLRPSARTRTRCSVLHAASQNRGPRISAPRGKRGAVR